MTSQTIIDAEANYTTPDFDRLDALFRLLIGVQLEGVELFFARLKRLEATVYDPTQFAASGQERPIVQLRYLLVGALYRSQRHARKRTAQALRVGGIFASLGRPVLRSVRNNAVVKFGMGLASAEIERLVGEGRLQEQNARLVTRHISKQAIDNVVDYLAQSDDVARLLKSYRPLTVDAESLDALAQSIVQKFSSR